MQLIDATRDAFALILSGDAVLWQIIWVSLKTTIVGLLIATPIAVIAGYAIATYAFPGRRVAIWLAQAALSFPTVLIGLLLYLMLSRQGPWGELQWLFSQSAVIAGQVLIALPVLIAFTLARCCAFCADWNLRRCRKSLSSGSGHGCLRIHRCCAMRSSMCTSTRSCCRPA
jgi:tungstate transport system permease protein